MPSEGKEYGYKSVMKGLLRVIIAYENVEDERNIDRKRSRFQGIFELVTIVNVCVEIRRFRNQ